ncbi:MAG: PST family polysaccharide transporter [Alteromonadaceae bacterium]|jgi:PST family polysaccharide transporter
MNLLKTSILSAVATLVRIVNGFVITKVISVYVGPSGLAVIGQLQNFVNLIMLGAGNFLKTAVTKYTAEYQSDSQKTYELWSSSIKISLFLNLIVCSGLFLGSEYISQLLFRSAEYSYVLKVLSISLPFFVFNTILLSILNGLEKIRKYIFLNIMLSVISFIIVVVLSIGYQLKGALIAYAINQSIVCIFTFMYLRKEPWLKIDNFLLPLTRVNCKSLFGFGLITFTSIVVSNISLMYLRGYLTDASSSIEAGYWQGIWTLSQVSLSLIVTSLTTYFLPTLSKIDTKCRMTLELKKGIKLIIPVAASIALALFLLRDYVILILYTDEFYPMRELFLWQMVGNVIKACAWLFGYVLVAKAMVKHAVVIEVLHAIAWVGISVCLIDEFGIVGITYSYAIASALHLIALLFIYKYQVFKPLESNEACQ